MFWNRCSVGRGPAASCSPPEGSTLGCWGRQARLTQLLKGLSQGVCRMCAEPSSRALWEVLGRKVKRMRTQSCVPTRARCVQGESRFPSTRLMIPVGKLHPSESQLC